MPWEGLLSKLSVSTSVPSSLPVLDTHLPREAHLPVLAQNSENPSPAQSKGGRKLPVCPLLIQADDMSELELPTFFSLLGTTTTKIPFVFKSVWVDFSITWN